MNEISHLARNDFINEYRAVASPFFISNPKPCMNTGRGNGRQFELKNIFLYI